MCSINSMLLWPPQTSKAYLHETKFVCCFWKQVLLQMSECRNLFLISCIHYYVHCRFTLGLVMLFKGENGNDHCSWCHYLSCVPTSKWKCENRWRFFQLIFCLIIFLFFLPLYLYWFSFVHLFVVLSHVSKHWDWLWTWKE